MTTRDRGNRYDNQSYGQKRSRNEIPTRDQHQHYRHDGRSSTSRNMSYDNAMDASKPQIDSRWTPPLSDTWLALGSRWESPPSYYSLSCPQSLQKKARRDRSNENPKVDGVSQYLKLVSPSPNKDIVHASEVHEFCFEDDFFSSVDHSCSLAYADDTNPLHVVNSYDEVLSEDPITLPPFFETAGDTDYEKPFTDQKSGRAYHEFQCEMSYSSKEQIIRGGLSSALKPTMVGFQLTRSLDPREPISGDIPQGGFYKGFFSVPTDANNGDNSTKEQSKMFTCDRVHLEFQCAKEGNIAFDVKGFGGIDSLAPFTISGEGKPIRKGGTTVGFDLFTRITCKSFEMI